MDVERQLIPLAVDDPTLGLVSPTDNSRGVVQTNTFNANRVSQGEYGLQRLVPEINLAAARLARQVADDFRAAHPEREVFVAGALGRTWW